MGPQRSSPFPEISFAPSAMGKHPTFYHSHKFGIWNDFRRVENSGFD